MKKISCFFNSWRKFRWILVYDSNNGHVIAETKVAFPRNIAARGMYSNGITIDCHSFILSRWHAYHQILQHCKCGHLYSDIHRSHVPVGYTHTDHTLHVIVLWMYSLLIGRKTGVTSLITCAAMPQSLVLVHYKKKHYNKLSIF